MNYAQFSVWIGERVEDLVAFGVPRAVAETWMQSLEVDAVNAANRAQSDRQFLLDFKKVGAPMMARRKGCSVQAIWQKRNRLLNQPNTTGHVEAAVDG